MKIWKQATYIKYVLANPSKHLDLFKFLFIEDSLKIKEDLKVVSRLHFLKSFWQKYCFVVLHELDKFHYQTAFTSQVIP